MTLSISDEYSKTLDVSRTVFEIWPIGQFSVEKRTFSLSHLFNPEFENVSLALDR